MSKINVSNFAITKYLVIQNASSTTVSQGMDRAARIYFHQKETPIKLKPMKTMDSIEGLLVCPHFTVVNYPPSSGS